MAGVLGAVLVVGFALARLSGPVDPTTNVAAGSPRPSGGPSTSARTPESPATIRATTPDGRVERLLEATEDTLPGAPEVTLVERTGTGLHDLRIVVWTPDDGRHRPIATIRGAVPEADNDPTFPVVAPDGRHVVILALAPGLAQDRARLIDDRGDVSWSAGGITASSGALWSPDSRLVVVSGQPRVWHLVALDRPGHARDTRVTLPREVFLPHPIPIGSITVPSVEPRTVPLGFSADGRWVYGGVISPELGLLIGAFRVSRDGATVERLADFGVGSPDGLLPRPGTIGSRTIDPATGRMTTSRINSDTTGGPRTIEVRAPDSSFLFAVDEPLSLGAEWAGDGRLIVMSASSLIYPESVTLHAIERDGSPGPPIIETGPVTSASFIGVRDGFAVVAILAGRPSPDAQLVAVNLADPGRRVTLPVPLDESTVLVAAGLDR